MRLTNLKSTVSSRSANKACAQNECAQTVSPIDNLNNNLAGKNSRTPASRAYLLGGLSLTILAAGSVGCGTKSWIDPGEVGRYEQTPLIVPILDRLSVGLEPYDTVFPQAREVKAEDLVVADDDYKLGSEDLVQINITDLVGPGIQSTEPRRVTSGGKISMPNLPNPITVAGLTEYETEVAVKKAYLDAQILADTSTVTVTVVEARNRAFRIGGAIPTPGQYLIEKNDYRLMDALLQAGQPQTVGSDYVYVIRKKEVAGATPSTPSDPTAPTSPSNPPAVDPLLPQGALPSRQPVASSSLESSAVQLVLAGNISGEFMANQPIDASDSTVFPATTPITLPGSTDGRSVQIEGGPVIVDQPSQFLPTTDPMTPKVVSDSLAFTGPSSTSFEGFNAPMEPDDKEVIRVPLKPLLDGSFRYNIVIRPSDFIIVQNLEVGEYYMGGHVARTGVYSMTGRKITLKNAIVSAGMFDQVAIPARTDIIRRVGPNQEIFVRVDLEKIFAGLEPDIYIRPNDQIMVGTNAGAPFLAAFRNAFRFTYGFGFLYDRNFFDNNGLN